VKDCTSQRFEDPDVSGCNRSHSAEWRTASSPQRLAPAAIDAKKDRSWASSETSSMATIGESFSPDYFAARTRFRESVRTAGGRLDTLQIAARGPNSQQLTIDIGWFGSENPRGVLLHSSGIHGVEGFAGSAIQLQFLSRMPSLPTHAATIVVHILNPFGMAWLRRCNETNVDLNRNFLGPNERYEGMPDGYAALDGFLNPRKLPRFEMFHATVLMLVARHGVHFLKQAIASGQYERPDGLFFGGKELEEGPRLYQEYLAKRLEHAEHIVAIDVHTGLGNWGRDALLVPTESFERLRSAFGERVQPLQADRSVAYRVRGGIEDMLGRTFSRVDFSFLGQEFGTRPGLYVLRALIEENRWRRLAPGSAADRRCKESLKETFCPTSTAWREAVLQRGDEVIQQALRAIMSK
jgi:hypothetical protein